MAESLGSLERMVLDALSRATEPLSVREVHALLSKMRLAYTTVLTVLDRLHEKTVVRREKRGRAFYYAPVVTSEQWRGQRAAELLSGRDSPPTRAVLMAFLDGTERASPDLLEDLAALLKERQRAGKKR
jgi:predicted transcriptional regulator